jgi:hypothetical protein
MIFVFKPRIINVPYDSKNGFLLTLEFLNYT